MEWHQIQYFKTVARMQHITRAAELLSVSQPALSRSISKLELELGVQLFDRQGRNIVLNRYGKMFLNRVERSIKEIEAGKQEIHDIVHPDHGTVSIAFLHSLGSSFVPEILSSFHNKFPDVKFQLHQDGSQHVLEQLQSGDTDVAFTTITDQYEEIIWKPILVEDLFLIVSVNHPLSQMDEIDLNIVKDEPFISIKNGFDLRTIIDQLCGQAGFIPNVAFEGEEIGTVAGLVAAKLGVSLAPDLNVLDKRKIKLIRVSHPNCMRTIGISWKKSSSLSPVTKRFIEFVGDYSKK